MSVATTDELRAAVVELEAYLPGRVARQAPEPGSGALLTIKDVDLGPGWVQPSGLLWVPVPELYPDAAPYPYYVGEAERRPEPALMPPLAQVGWRNMHVVQVSLRRAQWNPNVDSLLGCVMQVQEYLRSS